MPEPDLEPGPGERELDREVKKTGLGVLLLGPQPMGEEGKKPSADTCSERVRERDSVSVCVVCVCVCACICVCGCVYLCVWVCV